MILDVRERFRIYELDDIVLSKWMHGDRCSARVCDTFRVCKQIISNRRNQGAWGDEQQAEFEEQSLQRIETNMRFTKRTLYQNSIPYALA